MCAFITSRVPAQPLDVSWLETEWAAPILGSLSLAPAPNPRARQRKERGRAVGNSRAYSICRPLRTGTVRGPGPGARGSRLHSAPTTSKWVQNRRVKRK